MPDRVRHHRQRDDSSIWKRTPAP